MRLVDANVLLYATNRSAEQHDPARRWLERALGGPETVGFAWIVLLAFLRLATHPAVFARPLESSVAVAAARRWLEAPAAAVIEPSPRHLTILGELLAGTGSAGNLVPDAHLAALAIEHDATIVTFDTDFQRFAGVRSMAPGATARGRRAAG